MRYGLCSRCMEEDETLTHVLGGCSHSMGTLMTDRDAAVLHLLARACYQGQFLSDLESQREEFLLRLGAHSIEIRPGLTLLLDSRVPLSTSWKKPDFILHNQFLHTMYIVDVAVTSERLRKSLSSIRTIKLNRYNSFISELAGHGYRVVVDSFVMGALAHGTRKTIES